MPPLLKQTPALNLIREYGQFIESEIGFRTVLLAEILECFECAGKAFGNLSPRISCFSKNHITLIYDFYGFKFKLTRLHINV